MKLPRLLGAAYAHGVSPRLLRQCPGGRLPRSASRMGHPTPPTLPSWQWQGS